MKNRWKRALIWSSVGSVVVGAAVAVRRPSSRSAAAPPVGRRIPAEGRRLTIWTQHFEQFDGGRQYRAQDRYELQATDFKVWKLLDLPVGSEGSGAAGFTVYHVTLHRASSALDGEGPPDQSRVIDRLYATIGATDGARIFRRQEVARGGFLRLNLCRVGGASHGVETGEAQVSIAPVLNFRFEYAASAPVGTDEDGAGA